MRAADGHAQNEAAGLAGRPEDHAAGIVDYHGITCQYV